MMSSPDRPRAVDAVLTPGPGARTLRLGPATAGRCRRRVHLDFDPDADAGVRAPPDPGLQQRLVDLTDHRERTLATLVAAGVRPVADWSPASAERPPLLWAPVLRAGPRIAGPDLLVWDGDGYRPVIIRGHRTLDPGSGAVGTPLVELPTASRLPAVDRKARRHPADVLQLAHHHRILLDLGLAASGPARGGVIGRGGPSGQPEWDDGALVLWHELTEPILADYDRRFADRLAVATAAAARRPALARPFRVAECRRCPWWPRCSTELEAAHDISLLAAGADAEVLRAAGISTIDQLAALPASDASGLLLSTMPPLEARIRARAWLRGLPLVRRTASTSVPRADVELDVDMESYLDDGAYLWGTHLSGADVGAPPGYRAFVSWELVPDADEGRAFAEFWAYLTSLRIAARDHGRTFAAYCYSRSAEERWLRSTPRRYPDQPGMPTVADVAEFCASAQWVDLYAEIRALFVVPGSMRLKALAPVAGFGWRDPEPGGENSMAWYRAAVGADTGLPDAMMADRVLRYNEDDVLATLALRRWITERAHDVPTVADLEGPDPQL